MKAKKILFITQEITPYVSESPMACAGRNLPQAIQSDGREIRTFMPKWGCINERRNQLHEVIRLSGMNIIIDDTDHPLIIKVASIQSARMQVYFIDNDEYFHKRGMLTNDDGEEYTDNLERAVFYARGVLETVKKLRWVPDVIYCQGWMSAVVPLYIKTAYHEDPPFATTKIVFSVYGQRPEHVQDNFLDCLAFRNADAEELKSKGLDVNSSDFLSHLALGYSDAIIQGSPDVPPELLEKARTKGIPVLEYPGEEDLAISYGTFFDSLMD